MGRPALNYRPAIQAVNIIENSSTEILWDFAPEGNEFIDGFAVEHTRNPNTPYERITETLIPSTSRYYRDNAPLPINYYRIVAIGTTGGQSVSFPYMAQLEDSIPPAPPVDLHGSIDTTGVVTLQWSPNTEPDLAGYRVFRSNFRSAEFSQVTHNPVKRNMFIDTINIKTLTESIYYKVSAIDNRFNPSGFSEVLKLQRPDIVPPAPPVFKSVEADKKGVHLTWINSSSADVLRYLLYRRKSGDAKWKLIGIFEAADSVNAFNDTTLTAKDYYEYTMIAVDDSKLESEPANTVISKKIDFGVRANMKNVYGKPYRDDKYILLRWNYKEPDVASYVIYRSWEEQQYILYRTLPGDTNELIDKNITMNTIYKYRLKATFTNGDESRLSEEVIVNY